MIDNPPPISQDPARAKVAMARGAHSRGNAYLDPRSEPPEDMFDDIGIGHHDDTYAHDYGGSVRMMDLEPSLWEGDFEDETAGLWDYVG